MLHFNSVSVMMSSWETRHVPNELAGNWIAKSRAWMAWRGPVDRIAVGPRLSARRLT